MKKTQSVTTLPASPAEDRRKRMIQYTIAMSVRMVCVLLFFFVQGWWLLVVALGAVVLPYIAVVLANNGSRRPTTRVEPPGGVLVVQDVRIVDGKTGPQFSADDSDPSGERPAS